MTIQSCERTAFRGPGPCPEPAVSLIRVTYRKNGKVYDHRACVGHAVGAMKYARRSWANQTTERLPLPAPAV